MRNQHNTSAEEEGGISGIVTFTCYLLDSDRAREIDAYLSKATNILKSEYNALLQELKTLCSARTLVRHNKVVLAARTAVAGRLVGDTTYTGTINYGALGSGSTAVADSDTVLDTEVARVTYATRTQVDDVVTVDFYYNKGSTNGTYQEFGTFIDGTSSADTGLMFNRVLTGGWTKSATEAMTVSLQITVSSP